MSEPRLLQHFIDGQLVGLASGETFEDIDPCTGDLVARVCAAGAAEIDAACTSARRALSGPWGRMTAVARTEMMLAIARRIEERSEEFLRAECLDTGKPEALARSIDIPRGAANFRAFAELMRQSPGESFRTDTADGLGALNYTIRVPKGVIAVICPWNLPLLLMTWKVAPALACGNTVVVKPSEETPATTSLLADVMREVGLPAGVFNVVHGFGPNAAGELLTRHPEVDAITFTGETRTGAAIMAACAPRLADVSFELGGKNAGLVFADADLDEAVSILLRSCFANCGQVCLGTERLYVQRPVFEALVDKLVAATKRITMGPPTSGAAMGPLISRGHREKVLSYYRRAVSEGATVLTGGAIPDLGPAYERGAFLEPTLWMGLPEESSVIREEIFGPCAHIRPFDDEEEAIALANDTDYGLAATLLTRDVKRAHRVSQRLDVGIVWVNEWFLRDLRTPFGGTGRSGIGREGGVHSLEFYTETRNICVKL